MLFPVLKSYAQVLLPLVLAVPEVLPVLPPAILQDLLPFGPQAGCPGFLNMVTLAEMVTWVPPATAVVVADTSSLYASANDPDASKFLEPE